MSGFFQTGHGRDAFAAFKIGVAALTRMAESLDRLEKHLAPADQRGLQPPVRADFADDDLRQRALIVLLNPGVSEEDAENLLSDIESEIDRAEPEPRVQQVEHFTARRAAWLLNRSPEDAHEGDASA